MVARRCLLATSLGITRSFPRLYPCLGLVAFALLTLAPRPLRDERLACLIHAANVHSEPGSNPSKCAFGRTNRLVARTLLDGSRIWLVAAAPLSRHHGMKTAPQGSRRPKPSQVPCREAAFPRRLPSKVHQLRSLISESRSTGLSKKRRHPKVPTPEAGLTRPLRLIIPAVVLDFAR